MGLQVGGCAEAAHPGTAARAPRRRQEEAVLRTVRENKWDSELDGDK